MRNIKKILVHKKTGKKFYVKDIGDDFHTQYGLIKKNDFKKKTTESSKQEPFIILDPQFADLWESLLRGPQIMQRKDIGLILAKIGVNSNFKVVDAGGGSGSLCLSLANVCKEITVYEINPENYDVVQKNIALLGLKNITLKQENVYNGISENNVDLITLDLPEPWQAINAVLTALKEGGFLVVYLPNLIQMKQFIDAARKTSLQVQEIIELLERQWKIEDKIMRPEFEMLGHTGFMAFCRKW